MFPRLPFLPERYAHFAPVILVLLGAAGIAMGLLTDDTGFVILGTISIVVAVLTVVSRRVGAEQEDGEEHPSSRSDD